MAHQHFILACSAHAPVCLSSNTLTQHAQLLGLAHQLRCSGQQVRQVFSDHRSLIRGLTASALVASNDMSSRGSGGPAHGAGVKQGRRVRGTGASGKNRSGHSAALLAPNWQQQQQHFPQAFPPPPPPASRSGARPGSGSGGKKGRSSGGSGGGASADFNNHLLRAVGAAVAADADRLAKVVDATSNSIMQ